MRARIYIRVSTWEQAQEGFSLSAQEDRCRQFIESQGWTLDGIYRDDGYSAKDLRRPGMQQLIRDAENKEFDVLVVWRLDRLVRDSFDLHYLLRLFDKYDVKFRSVTEPYDTTNPSGRFFVSMIGSLAQWERENLIERVKVAMEKRALEGKRNGANPPYGYRLVDGKLIPHPEEAKVVRRIFETYRYRGLVSVVKELNDAGLRTRTGALWSIYVVRYILKNPVYIGKLRYRYRFSSGKKQDPNEVMVYEGGHEPIISEELWEEVQKKNAERQRGKAKALTSDYPFSGTVFCGRCGKPMHGIRHPARNGGYYYYYRCYTHAQYRDCLMPSVSEAALEEAIFRQIQYIAEDIEAEPESTVEKPERTREDIEKELAAIRRRKKKWQLAYAEDVITLDELRERTAEDAQREIELLEELEALEEEPPEPELNKEVIIERLKKLEYIWINADRRERKEILRSLFNRLVIDVETTKRFGSRHRPVKIIEYELA